MFFIALFLYWRYKGTIMKKIKVLGGVILVVVLGV